LVRLIPTELCEWADDLLRDAPCGRVHDLSEWLVNYHLPTSHPPSAMPYDTSGRIARVSREGTHIVSHTNRWYETTYTSFYFVSHGLLRHEPSPPMKRPDRLHPPSLSPGDTFRLRSLGGSEPLAGELNWLWRGYLAPGQ